MKIRPSIRLYFFISTILLSSVMTIGYSFLSVKYYINGLDKGLGAVMRELAISTELQDEKAKSIVGFHIAKRWQDTPEIIQQKFINAPDEPDVLKKLADQKSILSFPKNLYFVSLHFNPNNEKRFISRIMLEENRPKLSKNKPEQRLLWIFLTAIASIVLFALFLSLIMQKIAKPVENLRNWAKALNEKNINTLPPDFTYNELNTLATLVRGSLISAHEGVERERRFLSYASHELRTPISVIRSNVDLFKRLSEQFPLNLKQDQTLQRIERAGLTMSDLTETLLWLSQDNDQYCDVEPINLQDKIYQICEELKYLLHSKDVKLEIESQNITIHTEATACHIVLSNLIRNAYQHTQHGKIQIEQENSRVTIINSNHNSDEQEQFNNASTSKTNLGYGLGLQLSEKIIKRYGWQYEVKDTPGHYQVNINFNCNNKL